MAVFHIQHIIGFGILGNNIFKSVFFFRKHDLIPFRTEAECSGWDHFPIIIDMDPFCIRVRNKMSISSTKKVRISSDLMDSFIQPAFRIDIILISVYSHPPFHQAADMVLTAEPVLVLIVDESRLPFILRSVGVKI